MINPLFAIDFYKVDHRRQYPEETTEVYSNFTPRAVKYNANLIPRVFDEKVLVFGIQYVIEHYLFDVWQTFFDAPREEIIGGYQSVMKHSLGIEDFDCSHIEALHELGYLPIEVKSLEEGTLCPIGVPILTIRNTHPDFAWLTNYLETALSALLWKPITVATIAFQFRKLLDDFAKRTGCDTDGVLFQAHDFSARGMSGLEDAAICGAAHLTCFTGTDCVSALPLLKAYYEAGYNANLVGASVPATEHSVMTAQGREGEAAVVKRLITETYPQGILSIVADSYSLWNFVTTILHDLHDEIMNRDGKVVIRPDSGNPLAILCGDPNAHDGSDERAGVLELLWKEFGGSINDKGYRVLNPKIGVIYGDSITLELCRHILMWMERKGFASSNVTFGIGSYTYQYLTRDTLGFAMKATSIVVNGERKAIFKDPITDNGTKKSAKGLLAVDFDLEGGRYVLTQDVSEEQEGGNSLKLRFKDSASFNSTSLDEIRKEMLVELYYSQL